MNFLRKYKGIIIGIVICTVVLAVSFYYPEQDNVSVNEPIVEDVLTERAEPVKIEVTGTPTPTPKPKPTTVAPLETKEPIKAEEKTTLYCTLAIRCDTILNNMEKVAPEKVQAIPQNGIILPETEFEFSEGETVFDVLERELKNKKIHFEFTKVAMYDSSYIEGIGNLYEFDAGNLSGWIYRVNGKTPSLGCSQYKLADGDKIEFLYTCNMGRDL